MRYLKATDDASDNVLNSWIEGLTGEGGASYMRGWGVGDYRIVAASLARALKRERAKSPEGLEARVAALEEVVQPLPTDNRIRDLAWEVVRSNQRELADRIKRAI